MTKSPVKIVVLDGATLNPGDNPWDRLEALGQVVVYPRTSPAELIERGRDADVVVVNKQRLTAETLAQWPRLKLIAVSATGFDCVDRKAAGAQGITVVNVPVYGTRSVAQHTFALLLHLCHHVAEHDAAVRTGRWAASPDFCFWDFPQQELAGLTLGVIGFGRIGRNVALLGHAFGMRVLACSPRQTDPPDFQPFAWADRETIAQQSDVISLHCRLTAETAAMIDRKFLAHVRPSALLVNTSRGGLIQETDLADALNHGRLAGAALDVLSAEPPPPDHPLLSAKNCVITPHIAWATLSARRRLLETTAENIAAFLHGAPQNVV